MSELEAELRARDAFLATVAKKLQERVNALRLASPEAAAAALHDIEGFVAELSLVAHPEAPITLPDEETCLVDAVVSALPLARLAQAEVPVSVRREGTMRGRWSPPLVATVVGELLSNARKYSKGETIRLTLGAAEGHATLVVENVGVPAALPPAPARFRRGETNPKIEGYGVGAYLVRRIAEAHGGTSGLEVAEGKTRAFVRVPFTGPEGPRLEVRVG
ncbi:MAG: sensor histidine kinase [Myxococcales bacterium]|nr:sensor histidine kinase [Myxococcales bacterium]MBL9108693.1 sensor histidine kinase [Myxococcales bacterium]